MPFNGSGIWSWPYNWVNDAANGIPITASRMDGQFNDAGNNGFDNCLTRDGQGIATANLPMGGFKHTGVAAGTALTDYADVASVQNAKYNWVASAGTVDAITAAYSPAIASLGDGQLCYFRATGANTSATPTFAPSGLTAHTIVKQGGSALIAGDIPANLAECLVRYNLANTRWELLNPAKAYGATTGTGNVVLSASPTLTGTVAAAAATFSGTITPSSTNGIVGTTTNDSVNVGGVGELITATASGVSLSTATAKTITSGSLTAGDYDVWVIAKIFAAGGTTVGRTFVSISQTNNTLDTTIDLCAEWDFGSVTLGSNPTLIAGPTRISLSGTTTIYAVGQVAFGTSTLTMTAKLFARRRR